MGCPRGQIRPLVVTLSGLRPDPASCRRRIRTWVCVLLTGIVDDTLLSSACHHLDPPQAYSRQAIQPQVCHLSYTCKHPPLHKAAASLPDPLVLWPREAHMRMHTCQCTHAHAHPTPGHLLSHASHARVHAAPAPVSHNNPSQGLGGARLQCPLHTGRMCMHVQMLPPRGPAP